MSVEQLILLLFLVMVPLLQALRSALQRRRAARGKPTVRTQPMAVEQEKHAWEAPTAKPPMSSLPLRRPIPPRSATRPSSTHSRQLPPQEHPAPTRAKRILPKGRTGLRDALALMVVLGAPRALDPSERED